METDMPNSATLATALLSIASGAQATLTTASAATLLGISSGAVQAAIARGKLAATKHGRDWLIRQVDAEAYAATDRKPGPRRGQRKALLDELNETRIALDLERTAHAETRAALDMERAAHAATRNAMKAEPAASTATREKPSGKLASPDAPEAGDTAQADATVPAAPHKKRGRPRKQVTTTPDEAREANNAKRRERYANDAANREARLRQARKSNEKKREAQKSANS
jgi:excisionase family DNA binding protein